MHGHLLFHLFVLILSLRLSHSQPQVLNVSTSDPTATTTTPTPTTTVSTSTPTTSPTTTTTVSTSTPTTSTTPTTTVSTSTPTTSPTTTTTVSTPTPTTSTTPTTTVSTSTPTTSPTTTTTVSTPTPTTSTTPTTTVSTTTPTTSPTSTTTVSSTTPTTAQTTTSATTSTTSSTAATTTTTSVTSSTTTKVSTTTNANPNPSINQICPTMPNMNDRIRVKALDMHNYRRSNLAQGKVAKNTGLLLPQAKNMIKLRYDCDLENTARASVERCQNTSSTSIPLGLQENIQAIPKNRAQYRVDAITEAVKSWWRQVRLSAGPGRLVTFREHHQYLPIRTFTRMAWATTTHIGCAVSLKSLCGSNWLVACYYKPGGNKIGQVIYDKGTVCTGCPLGYFCDGMYLCEFR